MTQIIQQKINSKQEYIPGVCNIGPAERSKRQQSGIVATIATIVLLVIFISTGVSRYWRLLVILPSSAAAAGFLQNVFHFCAGFGMKGLYNVVNSAGITTNIDLEEFRRKDRKKAQLIITLSLLIGIIIGLASLV